MNCFNLDKIKTLSPNDAKEYITKYFIPLTDGNHALLKDNKYEILDEGTIKKVYFNRISKELNSYYFKEYTNIKQITFELNKDTFYENYLNLCPKLKHTYKPYESFDESSKEGVKFMLDFILDIINDGNEDSYKFLLKWMSNMVRGNKNNSCIVLKTATEGVGKSTLTTFIREYVIGDDLSLECGSQPLKTKFNNILQGRLMVAFEELENFSISEWNAISETLKRNITGSMITLEGKGTNAFTTKNINNYFILSNNEIKDNGGRRYFNLDISTKRLKDEVFFNKLYSTCFNDTVGHAFYCFLMEIDIVGFNPQSFPTTKSKIDNITSRLDNVYKFLKDNYILKNEGIDAVIVKVLYEEYKDYCLEDKSKAKGLQSFNKMLTEIGIIYYKSSDKNKYSSSLETLMKIANTRKWIHDLDDFETKPLTNVSYFNESNEDINRQLKKKDDEIEKLKKIIEELTKKQEEIVDDNDDQEVDGNDYDDDDDDNNSNDDGETVKSEYERDYDANDLDDFLKDCLEDF